MKIELREIDDTNKKDVASLAVADSQDQYIASNTESMKTAQENQNVARPFAIYADERLVGFAMFAFDMDYDDPNDRYWLWRFMIDKNQQGKGYGSAALEKIIEYFRNNGAGYIKLSTKDSNSAALSLYHKYEFKENGEMNGEETVLKLDL
jgi:diamine N-acetyltransferase